MKNPGFCTTLIAVFQYLIKSINMIMMFFTVISFFRLANKCLHSYWKRRPWCGTSRATSVSTTGSWMSWWPWGTRVRRLKNPLEQRSKTLGDKEVASVKPTSDSSCGAETWGVWPWVLGRTGALSQENLWENDGFASWKVGVCDMTMDWIRMDVTLEVISVCIYIICKS